MASLRGGAWVKRASSLGLPLKTILLDYADVFSDIFKNSIKRPIRTLSYVATATAITTVALKRPNYSEYVDSIVSWSNELGMCSDLVRNPASKSYLDVVLSAHYNGELYCINLGVVSLIVRRKHNKETCNYQTTCKWLQPRPWTIVVVDCGGWGRWACLERAMSDYDINQDELSLSTNDTH